MNLTDIELTHEEIINLRDNNETEMKKLIGTVIYSINEYERNTGLCVKGLKGISRDNLGNAVSIEPVIKRFPIL